MSEEKPGNLSILAQGDAVKSKWLHYRPKQQQSHGVKAWFIRRISAVSNAIETIDNEMICFIIYCLNCIRHSRNATYEHGLSYAFS